jgi:hypothetical protein
MNNLWKYILKYQFSVLSRLWVAMLNFRLQRCQSREGANLEYLKNVVLSFLLSSDSSSKRHMLNAIAAVLKFSSSELERVSCTHKSPI